MRRIFRPHARTHISHFNFPIKPCKIWSFLPKNLWNCNRKSYTQKRPHTRTPQARFKSHLACTSHTWECARMCVFVKIYFHNSQFENYYIKVDRLKVRKFQNENMKSSHCPKYERKKFWNFHTFTWVLKKCQSLTLNVNFQFQESSESFWK